MKASPAITSFNSGEFSPLMAGKTDFKYYASACKKLRNFIPTPQGPVRRRPGTHFVEEVKSSSNRTWLRRFVFSQDQSYMLEFGNLYIRFFADHGPVMSGMSPLEVVTPFTTVDLQTADGGFALRFAQSGDVLYIVSGSHPVKKLTRTGSSTFSFADMVFVGGPFEDIDPDETTTIYASAATGAVTLTASAATFNANMVGSLILLEQKNTDSIKQWEVGKTIAINDVRKSDGKNYKALTAGTTGSIKPTHTKGAKYDGDPGVQWDYLDPGYGWAEITGYTSTTVVSASVKSRIPDNAVGSTNATTRWALGAYSDHNGHPTDVAFFRERLTFVKGRVIRGSVAGDFDNFSSRDDGGLITKDMAYSIDITSDQADGVSWISPITNALMVGTYGDEFAVMENSGGESFGPGNIKSDKQSTNGGAFVVPATVGNGVLYVQDSLRKVRDIAQAESVEVRWESIDVTVLADHITKAKITQMVYMRDPDSVVWCVRADGALVGFTVNRAQDVRGWHPHYLGGISASNTQQPAVVECVEVMPGPDGDDELWMIVKRRINGSIKRYIEYMGRGFDESDDQEDAFYVDCGLTLDSPESVTLTPGTGADVVGSEGVEFVAGAAVFSSGDVGRWLMHSVVSYNEDGEKTSSKAIAKITSYTSTTRVDCTILAAWPDYTIGAGDWYMSVTSLSGLDHLEGESVAIAVDGASHQQVVVSSGSVNLDGPSFICHVGLPYRSVLVPMTLEAGAADGTSQGKTRRIHKLALRLFRTSGLKYGPDEFGQMDKILSRDASASMDTAAELFTGDIVLPWPGGYTTDSPLAFVQDEPLPATIVGVYPQIVTQDAR